MARKTIKGLEEIIVDLEKRLNEYKDIINARNKQIEQTDKYYRYIHIFVYTFF